MRVSSVHLRGFKRFTDFSIKGIPPTTKLVLLVGPNGVGKSTVFEAFNSHTSAVIATEQADADYHFKVDGISTILRGTRNTHNGRWDVGWDEVFKRVSVSFHDRDEFNWLTRQQWPKTAFYVRSGYRNEADFFITALARSASELQDDNRPSLLISSDSRVSTNYRNLVASAVADVFDVTGDPRTTREEIRNRIIGKVVESMSRVFPDLVLRGPGNPLVDGTFYFDKGTSSNWRYKNLSAGEKAAFDLLLDFVVKRERFLDTVFCIDEPELHMHTKLQAALLGELFRTIPDQSQLWVATHSIGMLRRAKELASAHPGTVAFLDFSDVDGDKATVLEPTVMDRARINRIFSVALDDLADLVAPSQIIYCEGRDRPGPGGAEKGLDARVFNVIFGRKYPDTVFVSSGGNTELDQRSDIAISILSKVFPNLSILVLKDRDMASGKNTYESERQVYLSTNPANHRVLRRWEIENYLYDKEVLKRYCVSEKLTFDEAGYDAFVNDVVNQELKDETGRIKNYCGITGSVNRDVFKVRLSQVVDEGMSVFSDLETCIFKRG